MKFRFLMFLFAVGVLTSCGKSYDNSSNSVTIDIYINNPLHLKSGSFFSEDDTLQLLLNLVNGKVPKFIFHRLDLKGATHKDSISMSFFNGIIEVMSDKDDYLSDMKAHIISVELNDFLSKKAEVGEHILDFPASCLTYDSLISTMAKQGREGVIELLEKNCRRNNGRCMVKIERNSRAVELKDTSSVSNSDIPENVVDPKTPPPSSKPFNVELTCESGMNSPHWKRIPKASKLLLEVQVEGRSENSDSKMAYGLKQALNGGTTSFDLSVKGGLNSTRSFTISLTAFDNQGLELPLKSNVIHGVHLSCSNY